MDAKGSSPIREAILEVKNVSWGFPSVKPLINVRFRVVEVEIHCLVGENDFLF